MKTIIFFSWQHLWSMAKGSGAPSYHNTIMHYINSPDWKVYLLTADATNYDLPLEENKDLFVFKDNKIVESFIKKPKWNHLVSRKRLNDFTKWAINIAKNIIKENKKCVLYAYEVWGVRPAEKLSKMYSIPLITRFQGTILNEISFTVKNRFLKFPHFEALETKSNLIIMTDDGTCGDKVVRNLKNDSPLVFLRNGLDLMGKYKELESSFDKESIYNALGIEPSVKILLMASRLTSWKKVDRGIKAFAEAKKNIGNMKLVIAGDGECRSDLEQLAKSLGVYDDVIFLGNVAQKDLYRYMSVSYIFLSLYDLSNLGNPTFEAMVMRNAIITLNGGATGSVIENNKTGILLEYNEMDRIPEKIIFLLKNEQERNRLADNAFDFAMKNFYTWEYRFLIEENRIKEILNERGM